VAAVALGRVSVNDRAGFPEQTLFLSAGRAGITSLREEYEHWLQILMMVSGFVLLIVCANVANLTLVRGLERRRQTSVSMALGAPALRLVRQVLTESSCSRCWAARRVWRSPLQARG